MHQSEVTTQYDPTECAHTPYMYSFVSPNCSFNEKWLKEKLIF